MILIVFGSMPGNAGGTKFDEFLGLELNAMGDAIAGASASLAFLWLLVTAFMQRAELAAQREELELTRSELFEQRLATQEIAKSTAAQVMIQVDQAKIFRREAELRESDYAVHEVTKILERVHKILMDRFSLVMTFEREDGTYGAFSMIECLPRNISRGSEIKDFTSAELIFAYVEADRQASQKGTTERQNDESMLRVLHYLTQVREYAAQMTPSARQIIVEDTYILEAAAALSSVLEETQ